MSESSRPSPIAIFDAINAHQKTEALRAAIDLDLFSAVAATDGSVPAVAARCNASPRGVRILCDFLAIHEFLHKTGDRYTVTADTGTFLVRSSPAYAGGVVEFLLADELVHGFRDLAGAVRHGGTTLPADGTMAAQHPVWVKFARVMGPIIGQAAPAIAALTDPQANAPLHVLDIAAGHGLFGIAFACRNPRAQVTAQDWAPVLEVAREHAQRAGVADRYRLLPGSAFEADLGQGYDVALLTNFLHHFDARTCGALLRRVRAAVKPGGVVATLEFVPNDDRITPPPAARFALTMLATTAAGDAYTFRELESMLRDAGFPHSTVQQLPDTPQSLVLSR